MILSIKATRRSADVEDMPDAGSSHIQGSNILEFEVPYPGPAPTVIVDCHSKHAFDTYQVRGETLPRRACPLRPKGAPAGPDGPPRDWVDEKTGLLKPSIFVPNPVALVQLRPSDIFAVISVSTCNGCKLASGGTVGLKDEQDAIRAAFHQQLQVEDFSSFPDLGDEDRDHRRWTVQWEEISIISG